MQALPAVLLTSLASASAASAAADAVAPDRSQAAPSVSKSGIEDSPAAPAARAAAEALRVLAAVLPAGQRTQLWPLFKSGTARDPDLDPDLDPEIRFDSKCYSRTMP